MSFKTGVAFMFYWRWTAQLYAWWARQHGYTTTLQRESNRDRSNAWELGGNYSVTLESNNGR